MNALQQAEYVTLRLVRRFVFTEHMANRLARWLPYYESSVNEAQPTRIVDEYVRALTAAQLALAGKRVLEVGAGRTNVVGYGLVAAGASSAVVLEPFVSFDAPRDRALRAAHPVLAAVDAGRVQRVRDFADVPVASIDLMLSNSVLEHVRDMHRFLTDCRRVLAPHGVMLHRVDYRDHFFKYPYGFLTFSDTTWSRWLDPGDLPRWRLPDHLRDFAKAGFIVSVLDRQIAADEFERIRSHLAGRFVEAPSGVEVTGATLLARVAA